MKIPQVAPEPVEAAVLLIDLDGTLVDSSAAVTRVWLAWCAKHGVEPEQVFRISEGRQGRAVIAELAPHLDARAEDEWLIKHQLQDAVGTVAVAGATEFLNQLPAERWAIVTSCTHALARVRLTAARLPLPAVLIGAEDVLQSKPAPDGFLLAATRLSQPADACLVFEDSAAGLESARRAQMRSIAVTTVARHLVPASQWAIRDWRDLELTVLEHSVRICWRHAERY